MLSLTSEVENGVVRRPILGEMRVPTLVCLISDFMGLSSTALAAALAAAVETDDSSDLAGAAAAEADG